MDRLLARGSIAIAMLLIHACLWIATATAQDWQTLSPEGMPSARHEAAMVGHHGKIYVLGGRRIHPADVFDPQTNRWFPRATMPIELHHFQAVSVGQSIYLVGAMNGPFPSEKPLEKVVVYTPQDDRFEMIHHIPASRRRGAAGAAVYQEKIYLVGGITNGHVDGTVNWLDVYDPKTGAWEKLSDAPHARDHCTAAIVDDKLYAIGGRVTTRQNIFSDTVAEIDVYDLRSNQWMADETLTIPVPAAGLMSTVVKKSDQSDEPEIYVAGGESGTRATAHDEVYALNPRTRSWRKIASLKQGRHGTGLALVDHRLYVAVGCGRRGGKPELDSIEVLDLQSSRSNPPNNETTPSE